jgi:endoglucanase
MAISDGIRHPLPSGWLSTRENELVAEDTPGGPGYRLAGVNWYGFECNGFVAGGLDRQPLDGIAGTIARFGFNSVRLPFSIELVEKNPVVRDYLAANPSLQGWHARDIMKQVVHALSAVGLKVILDCHRTQAGWSTQENGLWYDDVYAEEHVIHWLVDLLQKDYANNQAIIGMDVHNEPASPPPDAKRWPSNEAAAQYSRILGSSWGFGDPNPNPGIGSHTLWDLAAAAERIGNAVLAANRHLLIAVEGTSYDPEGEKPEYRVAENNKGSYWPGGNHLGVRHGGTYTAANGVVLNRNETGRQLRLSVSNKLVYSAHDYLYAPLPWCQLAPDGGPGTAGSPRACFETWEQMWGYLAREWIDVRGNRHPAVPVWLGEFGTENGYRGWKSGDPPNQATDVPQDQYTNWPNSQNELKGAWFSYLVSYIKANGTHWCYWALNGTQSKTNGRDPANPDAYGILRPDWTDWASPSMRAALEPIM